MSLVNSTIGEYRLDQFIGAGGMGEVYRAVHTKLGRVVAIKLLLGAAMDSNASKRFYNEARIQAGLRHPSIATLYEFLEFQGRPCIVMEYVEGETLAYRLRVRGAMPAAQALAVFRNVVEAVAYIHGQGIVHRDLKSNNIKITPSGEVRILDFGIAKSKLTTRVTQIGAVVGTLENLAPEQIEGRNADVRTDVWALGVLLYEMVCGRAPFEAPTVQSLYDRILRSDCPVPSAMTQGLPRQVDTLVRKCLKKNPDERYQSAGELLQALGSQPQASRTEPPAAPRQSRFVQPFDRRRTVIAGAAAVVLLLVLGLIFAIANRGPSSAPGEAAGEQSITVEVVGGAAEVWRDGRHVGETPFQFEARMGDRVELLLRRAQSQDLPVQFDVTERKVYSYTMEPVR